MSGGNGVDFQAMFDMIVRQSTCCKRKCFRRRRTSAT
jgi:hypothetical protein